MIKTQNLKYCENDKNDFLDEAHDNESAKCVNNFFHNIEENSKKIKSVDRPNLYYCHNFGIH